MKTRMRSTLPAIFMVTFVSALIGIDAEARRDTPIALMGASNIFESAGLVADRRVVRLGLGGDIETGAVGVGTVAADAATRIKYLDSDLDFAFGVVGSMNGTANAIATPEEPTVNADAQDKVRFHEMMAIGHSQVGQEKADEAEQMVLSLVTLPGRAENRMKRADAEEELACLTEAVYFEARGESIDGQIAVAEVILNRVESPIFPNTICDVITQGSEKLHACQFSYKCDEKPEYMNDRRSLQRAKDVAILLMKGERRAISNNATHYHADYVNPYWSEHLLKTSEVGTHIFYRRNLRRVVTN